MKKLSPVDNHAPSDQHFHKKNIFYLQRRKIPRIQYKMDLMTASFVRYQLGLHLSTSSATDHPRSRCDWSEKSFEFFQNPRLQLKGVHVNVRSDVMLMLAGSQEYLLSKCEAIVYSYYGYVEESNISK